MDSSGVRRRGRGIGSRLNSGLTPPNGRGIDGMEVGLAGPLAPE